MGLLSDPSAGQRNRLTRTLNKHGRIICSIFYLAGIMWFACLAHNDFNHGTYLSENALSPGLVYPEMQDTNRLALVEELKRERENHPLNMPVSWLVAKMKQIGLEAHVHNFTLRYPFEGGREYHGQNVYGILRAPRIGSTEGVVYTAPYRAANSPHTDIIASIPILLSFADFARKQNYWAKDLVFLVTEQEQLGMYAWLEAYHKGGTADDAQLLRSGNLAARAGALQAAINLEVQDLDFEYLNVKIEGLNGQLPNLDLFNLVQRITIREGIASGYQHSSRKQRHRQRSADGNMERNLKHMASMLLRQASGVPTGNHGLFHRYRIESLTLEAVQRVNPSHENRLMQSMALLKTLEGISRSLNNLLERFHQSFFFYILVNNERFVSIGDFMPCIILLVAPLLIKAFLLWLSAFGFTFAAAQPSTIGESETTSYDQPPLRLGRGLLLIACSIGLGILLNVVPRSPFVRNYGASLGIGAATSVSALILIAAFASIVLPFLIKIPEHSINIDMLHITGLLSLACTFIVIGLLNFALGFLVALVCVPLSIFINCSAGKVSAKRQISQLYAILVHPVVMIYGLVLVITLPQFPELTVSQLLMRALSSTVDAITFALMDCIIYGNWLYTAVTAVFLPIWILHWTLTHCYQQTRTTIKEKDD